MTFVHKEAQNDFDRARNQAVWQQTLSFLTGKDVNLIEYDEVRKRLAKTVNRPTELRDIPIKAIVGTVSRGSDFTRTFLPKDVFDKSRWVRVKVANELAQGIPPIDVYQIGDVYFVIDGHHRVSVMRSNGAEEILANVRVINSDVPLKAEDSPDAIIVKTEKQAFLDKTRFDKLLPGEMIDLKLPGEYPALLEHIVVHQYFMGIDEQRSIIDDEAVRHWYASVYQPVVKVIRDQQLLKHFPDKTEAELYLWIEDNKARLTEEYGDNLRNTSLAWKLDDEYGRRSRGLWNQLKRRFYMLFSPDLSDWGMKTGDWRRELLKDDLSPLIRRMMIALRNPETDLAYLRSGIHFAKQNNAWVGIVHVVKRPSRVEPEWIRRFEKNVQTILDEEGVRGNFFVLRGNLLKNLSERAFWSDISLFKMNYRPAADGIHAILPGWHSILMHIPGPIFITPTVVPNRIAQIVLAFSQSPKSREALYFADALSKSSGAKVFAIVSGFDEEKCESARQEVEEYFRTYEVQGEVRCKIGKTENEILELVREVSADIIVMGGYSRSLMNRLFTGSTIEKIMSSTSTPLIICK